MSSTISDVEKAQMMLSLGMGESGEPLTASERSTLEEFVAQSGGEVTTGDVDGTQGAMSQDYDPSLVQQQDEQQGGLDIQAMVQAEVQRALGTGVAQAAPTSFEDVLKQIDPRDSDAALAMFNWLSDNGRFGLVGQLNGGGYLLHYSEPKGTTKAGYTPGATKGGRMVDQAVAQAKEAGAKPRQTGLCDKCWSAVEKLDDGSIVSDDDQKNPVCSAGGDHTFNG